MRRLLLASLLLPLLSCGQPPFPGPAEGVSKPVAFAILEDYDKGEALARVETDFRLMRQLGVRHWRGSFGWDDYEPQRGRYDFEWLHRFVELAERHQLQLHPYLGYTPEWAARGGATAEVWNDPPARLEEWRRFVTRMGSEMKRHPNVVSFEIYNEENVPQWWDGDARDYGRVLKAGSEALHDTNPRLRILLGGLVFPDLDWMEQLCAAGAGTAFDILPIHAYPETWTPPHVTVENYLSPPPPGWFNDTFLAQTDSLCGAKPIWINEAGFATVPGRTTERDQANWWARAIATFLAIPRVEQLGIYELRDHRPTSAVIGEPENYHLGLLRADGHRKEAFATVRLLVQLLDTGTLTIADDGARLDVIDGKAGELHHHLFLRPDGKQILFVWDKQLSPLLRVTLRRAAAGAVEYALDGTSRPYREFDGHRLDNIRLAPGQVRIFLLSPS